MPLSIDADNAMRHARDRCQVGVCPVGELKG